jgi:hypothetical protein
MDNTYVALGYFFIALLTAHLQLEFLRAREERRAFKAAAVDFAVTGLHAVPVLLLVMQDNWQVLVAEALANFVATYWGVRRLAP